MSAKRKSPDEESTNVPAFAGPRSVGTCTASASSATVHVPKKAASSWSEGANARGGKYHQEGETLAEVAVSGSHPPMAARQTPVSMRSSISSSGRMRSSSCMGAGTGIRDSKNAEEDEPLTASATTVYAVGNRVLLLM